MAKSSVLTIRTALAISSGLAIVNKPSSHQESPDSGRDSFFSLTQTLKQGLIDENLKRLHTYSGVEIYRPRRYGGRLTTHGLPIARVAVFTIQAPMQTIVDTWADHLNRKEWDKSLENTQYTLATDENASLLYAKKLSRFYIPSREFLFREYRGPGGTVGVNDFNAVCFIHQDAYASEGLPTSWDSVRGRMNSLLLLEPKGGKTKVTFVIEADPKGWLWLFPGLDFVNFWFGNDAVESIIHLKKTLEEDEQEESLALSVEEAARIRFQKRRAKEEKAETQRTILGDAFATKEDLEAIVGLLQKRLKDLSATERAQNLDLSELKSRVQKDLAKAKEKLRNSR